MNANEPGHSSEELSTQSTTSSPKGPRPQAASSETTARRTREEAADTPSILGQAVEGMVAGDDGEEQPIDRALILGRDGRWFAGWALRFIIVVIAAVFAFKILGAVWKGVLPILLALLICTVLWPPVKWMRDHKIPAALAVIVTMLGTLGILFGVFAGIAPSVTSQFQQVVDRTTEGARRFVDWVQGPPLNLESSRVDEVVNEVTAFLQDHSSRIASGVFTGLSTASSFAVTAAVTMVLVFFFLKDGTKFLPWLRKFTGNNVGWHLTEVLSRTWNTLAGFIRAQAAVSLVDAVFIGIGLVLLKVPMALALAVITFFAGFIPIIGAVSAGFLAVVIALVSNGFTNALLALLLILVVQQLESNILSPILQSKAMDLHAAIVLLAVTVGGTLFGIVGAFLAVPVAATIAVWLRYHSELVSLRAGEITIDDIEIATSKGKTITSQEAFNAVRGRLTNLSGIRRRGRSESTVAPKAYEAKTVIEEDPS